MFSINQSLQNNNYIIIIIFCVVSFYLCYINSKTTSCTNSAHTNSAHTYSAKTNSDSDYIKNIISKQEKILIDLKQKIEKKLAEKKSKSKAKSHTKSNTIETLDGSIELSKTPINKHKKLAKINSSDTKTKSSDAKTKSSDTKTKSSDTKTKSSIHNIDHDIYPRHPVNPHFNPFGSMIPPIQRHTDPMYIRDNQVLNDKLYPPLGRTERPTADLLMNFINNQPDLFNMHTRGPPDTFRPIGYLAPKNGDQTIDSTLILYGRAKYPNSDLGEFYVTSSNKMSDIKIPILQNNSNIRKITDVPTDVQITGSIFNGDYIYTELPKPDFTYPYV